jgi:hypothetical protein
MDKIRVEGYTNLYRDDNTGAIINTDDVAYEMYISSKKRRLEYKKTQREEIDSLKNEVSEIKSLLMELLNESRRNRTE